MVVRKDDLHNLIDRLKNPINLIERSERKPLREEINEQANSVRR